MKINIKSGAYEQDMTSLVAGIYHPGRIADSLERIAESFSQDKVLKKEAYPPKKTEDQPLIKGGYDIKP